MIKICGVRDVASALAVMHAGADHVGLVFVPGSPRFVSAGQARAIVQHLRLQAGRRVPEPVGLFCNHHASDVLSVCRRVGLKVAQLHGDEAPDAVAALSGLSVFKAVPWDPARLDAWRHPPANVAALLIDAPATPGGLPGGTGRTVDWSAVGRLDRAGLPPIVLAGGLTPENVGQAIRAARPDGVDVSSGVELRRGVKDAGRIAAFCDAARKAFALPA